MQDGEVALEMWRVIANNLLHMNSWCDIVAERANVVLWCINRGITNKSREVILPLYLAVL